MTSNSPQKDPHPTVISPDTFRFRLEEAHILFAFGIGLTCGTPILELLQKLADQSKRFAPALTAMHKDIKEGGGLQHTMRKSGLFTDFVVSLIGIGEETGDLDKIAITASHVMDRIIIRIREGKPRIDLDELPTAMDLYMLAALIDAGLPIGRSMVILEQNCSEKNRAAIAAMAKSVESGNSLSVAMKEHGATVTLPKGNGKLSDKPGVDMIRMGEEAGTLDHAVTFLAASIVSDLLGSDFQLSFETPAETPPG